MELVRAQKLSFTYSGGAKALSCASMTVGEGEFVLLVGASGCGKTTLLRLFKPEIAPFGELHGELELLGTKAQRGMAVPKIGFVMQDPQAQAVSDTVNGELAFGLINQGLAVEEISRVIGETASFFGISQLMDRRLDTLSGGERQLVSICSVMVMKPKLLILDEPLSRLDPLAAARLVELLGRINRETGAAVLIAEHHCEGLFELCDKAYFMNEGKILDCCRKEEKFSTGFNSFLPCAARIASVSKVYKKTPLNVREGISFLRENYSAVQIEIRQAASASTVLEGQELYFSYGEKTVLSGCNVKLLQGEVLSIIGANGCGKSTLIHCLSGAVKPSHGKVKLFGKGLKSYKNGSLYRNNITVMPQEPQDIFTKQSVGEELDYAAGLFSAEVMKEELVKRLELSKIMDTHPYDLSGGELQIFALARLLMTDPKVILLDEPVKGLDPDSRTKVGQLIRELAAEGRSVLMVTHDLEFAAEYSDRCAMLFDGALQGQLTTGELFTRNEFYTTPAARICRGHFQGVYTVAQAQRIIKEQDSAD